MQNTDDSRHPRELRILDVASDLITRYGYDKTTVSEIADAAGISKGAIYLHFDSKVELFEALLVREMIRYSETWLELVEADPDGGTMGGMYTHVLRALESSPLMKAIYGQDIGILGSYIQKPGNIFNSARASSMNADFIKAMQEAGAVRAELDANVVAHVIDAMGYGLLSIGGMQAPESSPPIEETIEFIGQLMDRTLSPEEGADTEAGKAVIRQATERSSAFLCDLISSKDEDDNQS